MLSNVALGYSISNSYKKNIEHRNNQAVSFAGRKPPEMARKQTAEAINARQLLRNVEAFFERTYSSACTISAEETGVTNPDIEKAGKKILRSYTRPTGQAPYIMWDIDKREIIPSFEKMIQTVDKMIEVSTAEAEKLQEQATNIKNTLNAKKIVSEAEEHILRQYNFYCGQKDYAKIARNILNRAIDYCKIV